MPDILRFDDFELDKGAFELRRAGRVVRLERIPLELLFYLTERPGQLVSREEILRRIWGEGVFVDADNAINTAVRKIRQALRDDADNPRYVLTVPGKGYRFTAETAMPQTASIPAAPGAISTAAAPDEPTRPSSNGPSQPLSGSRLIRRRRVVITSGATALVLAAGAFMLRSLPSRRASTDILPSLEELEIIQLTTSGNAERPAISPDGRYVAYVQRKNESFSVRVRQIATGSDVEVVRPDPDLKLEGLTVTPDGAFLDIVGEDRAQGRRLRRVPFLGGAPRRLIDAIDSPVSWAPDGRHLAFVRGSLGRGRTTLVMADPDGANEHELAARQTPAAFVSFGLPGAPPNAPAWSPDGQSIALLGQTGTGSSNFVRELIIVRIPTGSMRTLTIPGSSLNRSVAWLDTNALIINHGAELGAATQLWRVAVPDGRFSRLSNDLNDYDGLTLTADRRILATGRRETRVGVWVGNGDAGRMVEAIPPAPFGSLVTGADLAWAGDALLYTAMTAGQMGTMRIVRDREGLPHEFLPHAAFPSASSDGQTIVFQRDGLWKVDGEGRNPARLASDGFAPVVAPDGRNVIFLSSQSGIQSPWILPVAGGTATQIVSEFVASVLSVDVSPDSRSLVFSTVDNRGQRMLVFCNVPTCTTKRTLTLPFGGVGRIRWTLDGRGVAFLDAVRSNVWVQTLDGGPPRQETHFDDGRTITDFAWSRDGKRLAVARASSSSDIVLFKGLRR